MFGSGRVKRFETGQYGCPRLRPCFSWRCCSVRSGHSGDLWGFSCGRIAYHRLHIWTLFLQKTRSGPG